jgi:hypothetical protein
VGSEDFTHPTDSRSQLATNQIKNFPERVMRAEALRTQRRNALNEIVLEKGDQIGRWPNVSKFPPELLA